MNRILCLCEVAALARDLQWDAENAPSKLRTVVSDFGMSKEKFDGVIQRTTALIEETDNYSRSDTSANREDNPPGLLIDPTDIDRHTGGLSNSQRMKLIELLGDWYVCLQHQSCRSSIFAHPFLSYITQGRTGGRNGCRSKYNIFVIFHVLLNQ